jgi:hypothetical protein
MKKVLLIVVFSIVFVSSALAVEKPLGIEEFVSLDPVAAQIVAYFPKIQGEVTAVQAGSITIALGSKDGLQTGVVLTLWRDSKDILHPVTGAVIGRTEDQVGTAEVTSIAEKTCIAKLRDKTRDPKPGDKARITPKKINLAVVPLRADRPELVQNIIERLNDSGRFALADRDAVAAFLKDNPVRDVSLLRQMSATFHLDVIAAIGMYPADGKVLATVRLFYADESKPLDTIVAMVDLRVKQSAMDDVKPYFEPAKEDAESIADLPFDARLIVGGDLDHSGGREYAISDGKRVHIYRRTASGWHEDWAEPAPLSTDDVQHINLDVADVNGNGTPELFVTAIENGKAVSHVIEYRDGSYQRIADVPAFLRVVSFPGAGPTLLGVEYNPKQFYEGTLRKYEWKNGTYVPGAEAPLPKGVNLYGFTYASLGESSPMLVVLDEKDRLAVYSRDTVVWRSEETYPSVGTKISKPVTSSAAVVSQSIAESERGSRIRIPGRVVALDLNNDGRDEIVVPKNIGDSFLGSYSKAEISALGWTGARLEQRWGVKDVSGAVLDFGVFATSGSAQLFAIVKTPGGLTKSDTYRVMNYTMK